jgi:hypothetical protein
MLLFPFHNKTLKRVANIAARAGFVMLATTFKWAATWTDRSASTGGTVSTELNALANGAFSAVSAIYDNGTNLDEWASFVIDLASLTPTAGAYLQIFLVDSLDGTNYEDAPSTTNPGIQKLVATVSLNAAVGTKREITAPFRLPPGKMKWVVKNAAGVALGATGNTCKLFTTNEQAL